MATQRITIAKLAGVAADLVTQRFRKWSAARQAANPKEWSSDQWPPQVRALADELVDQIRSHSTCPPVLHYIEWIDMWAMGDLFDCWLTPPDCPYPHFVFTDNLQVYAYPLPDGGRLARHLANAGAQQFQEYDWYVQRLREAVAAWDQLVDHAILVVVRDVVGATVTDDQIRDSLTTAPDWLV